MSHRRSPVALLVLVAGSTVLVACGSPSYEYVRNTEARTAFKVPIEWAVFDEATLQGEQAGPPVSTPDPVEWLIGLDAHPSPSIEHVMSQTGYYSDYPQGIAAVLRWPARKGGKRAMLGPSGWVCTKGCVRQPGYRGGHCEHHPE